MCELTSPSLPLSLSPPLDLWRAYHADPTVARRNALAVAYLPLVDRVARGMARRMPANVEFEDLAAAGAIGLLAAIERYDPARGPFNPYAAAYIRGGILDQLREMDWAARGARSKGAAVPEMLATPWDVQGVDVADHRAEPPGERLARRDALAFATRDLIPLHRAILEGRFLRGWTIRRIAAEVGRSQGRVCQLLPQILARARK